MKNLELANHPNTLPETLQHLATDDHWHVRWLVAQHPNTPVETLQLLATDEYGSIRYEAAHHPNATELVRRLYLMTEAQYKKNYKV
jgi:hypothetical protein